MTSDAKKITSRIIRTTLDLDQPVIDALKALQKKQNQFVGKVAASLLAKALKDSQTTDPVNTMKWNSDSMGARVDTSNKEALNRVLDQA